MAAMNLTCAVNEKEKLAWRGGAPVRSTRVVAEERAIALTYCGSTYAVMMATPDISRISEGAFPSRKASSNGWRR